MGQCKHAFYKYYIYLNPHQIAPDWNQERIIGAINEAGVPCYSGSCSEVYLEKAFDSISFRPSTRFPIAKELGETSIMFLVHPTISVEKMQKAGNSIREVLSNVSF